MSLLTPLYIAGVLAVALPILFHLLRRAPQKRQTFSSLMFLSPTPPRFTRRSRISNWLLLLLRAAVLTLLAFAFARPFLPQSLAIAAGGNGGQHIAILIDTSASMRREDLWTQAKQHGSAVLRAAGVADKVSLYLFDRTVRPAFTFEQWNRLDVTQRAAAVEALLGSTSPTWESTSLGDAVTTVAELLANANDGQERSVTGLRTLVLISDLQQGGRPEALQGRAWPESVRLDVRPVAAKNSANASLEYVRPSTDAPSDQASRPRVRVNNSAESKAEHFSLAWANTSGLPANVASLHVYAPAGRGQIVRPEIPPGEGADRLVLQGDSSEFDNTLYFAPPRQQTARVLFVGRDSPDDVNGLAFYVRTAFGDTPQRRVEVVTLNSETVSDTELTGVGLVILGRAIDDASAASFRQFVEKGGTMLWVLRAAADDQEIGNLLGDVSTRVEESGVQGFSLLSRIDTTHPLLATFAEARFGDFSRVHFWKHRKLSAGNDAGVRTLASFDNGDPFLIERPIGRGRFFVMTSGWHPADSQLALSTKFVPILEGLLRPQEDALQETQYTVGDTIVSPPNAAKTWTAKFSDGQSIALPAALGRPGIYTINTGSGDIQVAVNLRPDESRTTPITPDDFKQWGVKLYDANPIVPSPEEQRQAQRAELENRQKLWQWLIVVVLGLIAVETVVAGRLARRGTPGEAPAAG